MQISVEAIIAIVGLFVALPPIFLLLVKLYRRYRFKCVIREQSAESAELELQPMVRDSVTSASPPQAAAQNLPWRTTIRMIFEDGNRTQLLELSRNQQSNELVGSGSDVHLLADGQIADYDS
ncbi:hypothetical protein GGR55DRAFT_345297 [Xylaria sp. FL0064]|nr:hypothetical protein GGR55DRAFT_345297 [Xylaria sp. FL0064]